MNFDPFNSALTNVFSKLSVLNLQYIAAQYNLAPMRYTSTCDTYKLLTDMTGRQYITKDVNVLNRFMQVLCDAGVDNLVSFLRPWNRLFEPTPAADETNLPPTYAATPSGTSSVGVATPAKSTTDLSLELQNKSAVIKELNVQLQSIEAKHAIEMRDAISELKSAHALEMCQLQSLCDEKIRTDASRSAYQINDLQHQLAAANTQMAEVTRQLREFRNTSQSVGVVAAQPTKVSPAPAATTTAAGAPATATAVAYANIPGFRKMLNDIAGRLPHSAVQSMLFIARRPTSYDSKKDVLDYFQSDLDSGNTVLFGPNMEGLRNALSSAGCAALNNEFIDTWLDKSRSAGYSC